LEASPLLQGVRAIPGSRHHEGLTLRSLRRRRPLPARSWRFHRFRCCRSGARIRRMDCSNRDRICPGFPPRQVIEYTNSVPSGLMPEMKWSHGSEVNSETEAKLPDSRSPMRMATWECPSESRAEQYRLVSSLVDHTGRISSLTSLVTFQYVPLRFDHIIPISQSKSPTSRRLSDLRLGSTPTT